MMGISQFRLPGAGIGMMALFHEKIVQGKFQLDRTGHDELLKRKGVCLTPVLHRPIFSVLFCAQFYQKLNLFYTNFSLLLLRKN